MPCGSFSHLEHACACHWYIYISSQQQPRAATLHYWQHCNIPSTTKAVFHELSLVTWTHHFSCVLPVLALWVDMGFETW